MKRFSIFLCICLELYINVLMTKLHIMLKIINEHTGNRHSSNTLAMQIYTQNQKFRYPFDETPSRTSR